MSRFTSEHLETLLAAVDGGSFEAAARALGITPSAVSQRVKAMEQLAGRLLVQRTAPVRPTAAGEVVLRLARQVRLLDEEASRTLDGGGADVPSIALAVNADSLATWFLDALVEVRRSADVVFELHREDQDRTAELLRDGTVVAAVTAERRPVQGCTSVPLGVDRYLAVAAPGFVRSHLAGRLDERAVLDGLDRVPLVDYDRDDDLQQGFLRRVLGHAPRSPRHLVPSSADFARAVELGAGAARDRRRPTRRADAGAARRRHAVVAALEPGVAAARRGDRCGATDGEHPAAPRRGPVKRRCDPAFRVPGRCRRHRTYCRTC
jgi:LysR family transcriptional regulator (chromosome initiation inhibitor)